MNDRRTFRKPGTQVTAAGPWAAAAPYDRHVSPMVAGLLGLLVGVLAGALGITLLMRDRARADAEPTGVPPADLVGITEALRCAVAVVGPQDDIVVNNSSALSLGVVRGTRVAIPALLDLVRDARVSEEPVAVNLDYGGRSGDPTTRLAVRVLPLSERRVFVVADDRAPALRMQKSSRDFMANATHELKTPVGALILLGEAIEEAADDPEAVRRFSLTVQHEARRLGELVAQIIMLSRLQGDPMSIVEPVDVDALIERSLGRSRELAERREISLTTGGVHGLQVLGDHEQLGTAITNLVHNAIAYSDPKGRVVITTRLESRAEGDMVAIAVSDNGIGIAEEDQQRIFERFYRVDYARTRETGGTGLGLSIVAEIVRGHGGEVSVWSALGNGSTFTVRLPVAPQDQKEEA